MDITQPISGPGYGLHPAFIKRRAFFRAAAAVGDLMAFDMADDDTDTTSVLPGAINSAGQGISIWNSIVDPPGTPVQRQHGFFGIALEVQAADTWGDVCVEGICTAFVHTAAASVAVGDMLVADTDEVNAVTPDFPVAGINKKVLGIALAIVTTPTTPALTTIYFNGLQGLGSVFTQT